MDKHNVVMPSWAVRWLVNALALLIISFLPFRGGRLMDILGLGSVIMAVAAVGLINAFVRQIFSLFSLPQRDISLVLFALGANIVVLLIADAALGKGFGFPGGFFAVLVSAILLALVAVVVGLVYGGAKR